jgi:hypothetical protein
MLLWPNENRAFKASVRLTLHNSNKPKRSLFVPNLRSSVVLFLLLADQKADDALEAAHLSAKVTGEPSSKKLFSIT